jgi:hypothetical protein
VAAKGRRPPIPETVLPGARKLIAKCWESDRADWPSFEEIVERLADMEFRVRENVYSAKLALFVKKIEDRNCRINTRASSLIRSKSGINNSATAASHVQAGDRYLRSTRLINRPFYECPRSADNPSFFTNV